MIITIITSETIIIIVIITTCQLNMECQMIVFINLLLIFYT